MIDQLREFATQFTPGATGVWAIAAMLLVHFGKQWTENRKLSLDDRMAKREGYAKQVESLQRENRSLRADIARMHSEHEAYRVLCHQENDQLREMVIRVENELEGLKRLRAQDTLMEIRTGRIDDAR